jgi:hypothetical protein
MVRSLDSGILHCLLRACTKRRGHNAVIQDLLPNTSVSFVGITLIEGGYFLLGFLYMRLEALWEPK